MRLAACVCFALALPASGFGAPVASLDTTPDQFRQAYGARLKQDGHDGIASCRILSKAELDCIFRGDPNAGARGYLSRVDHREHIALQSADGKLAAIVLNGQRNSAAATRHFIGLVASVIGTLSPALDKAKIDDIVAGLGLTRDDSAPDLGTSLTHSEPSWSISCLNQFSQVSTDLACTVEPAGP